MPKLNEAQQMLVSMGVDVNMLTLDKYHNHSYSPSYTKKGSGRIHKQVKSKGTK